MGRTEPSLRPALCVKDVAVRLRVDPHRILSWIRSGKLGAMDVSAGSGKKARWRILPEALAAFEAAQTHVPPTRPSRRQAQSGWQFTYF